MNDDHNNPDSRLEWAVDSLREVPVPAGPDEAFRQRLAERLSWCGPALLSSKHHTQRRRNLLRRSLFAASVLAVSLVIGWLVSLGGRSDGAAFARMLEQVEGARTVVFTTRVEMPHAKQRMESKTMLLEPDWERTEMFEGEEGEKTVLIQNLKQRKSLTLMPDSKKARLRDMVDIPAQPMNAIDEIRAVREASAELLGTEPIEGRDTRKYRCLHPTGHYLIWVDADSDLPVKVVMSEAPAGAKEFVKITIKDFQWNVPLDAALFTLDVPAGYEIEHVEAPRPGLDPKNFIATLKVFVRLNDDQFPDEYNALTPGSMIQFLDDPSLPPEQRMDNYRRKLAEGLERPELEKLSDEEWKKRSPEFGRMFAEGAVFLQILAQSHDWHYTGKGVKLGEADRIVAWWAPKKENGPAPNDDVATVLYGDLHVETNPVAGLPIGD